MAKNQSLEAGLSGLEKSLDLYLAQKAPSLPKNIKEILVNMAPWLTLIFIILSLPIVFALFGLQAILAPFGLMGAGAAYAYSLVGTVILIVALVIEGMAIPGLFARSRTGWKRLYIATLIVFLSSLTNYNIVGGAINALISLYFLFQVKEYYK